MFSNRFLDFAATETAGTDPKALCLSVDQCPDWLEVGLEDPLGLVIGVTDVMAGLTAFATEIACVCHGYIPPASRIDIGFRTVNCNIAALVYTSRIRARHGSVSPRQDAEKPRQRRSHIAQRLNAETNFLGGRKYVRGFSVCQELLRRANGSTKCGPYLLASSLAAALLDRLLEHPELL